MPSAAPRVTLWGAGLTARSCGLTARSRVLPADPFGGEGGRDSTLLGTLTDERPPSQALGWGLGHTVRKGQRPRPPGLTSACVTAARRQRDTPAATETTSGYFNSSGLTRSWQKTETTSANAHAFVTVSRAHPVREGRRLAPCCSTIYSIKLTSTRKHESTLSRSKTTT